MIIDNTHELQRIFSQIIRESEGYITDDTSNSSNIFEGSYFPTNYGKYSTRDEMIKILNGEKKITSSSQDPYPYTDDGKTYIYMSGDGSPFYPITNIEKKDNQIIFSISEKDCIDWEKYEDNIEGQDKRVKDEERNSNNSSLMSNGQVLEQCKGIDEHTEFLVSKHNKLYPIKRMDVVVFNKHDTIVLHADWMDIDEIRDIKAKAEKSKRERENNEKKKDQEIQQLIRWVTKKFGKTGYEAKKFATNIYNKKHGLSKQKTRYTDQYPKKYKMSDGNTTIYVNSDDVYDAKKDGFYFVREDTNENITEDGKEGHKTISKDEYGYDVVNSHTEMTHALDNMNAQQIKRIVSALVYFIASEDSSELVRQLRYSFGKKGNEYQRRFLDAFEKIYQDERKRYKNNLRDGHIDLHNKDPKHFPHPDKIDVKNMKKPNIPNE